MTLTFGRHLNQLATASFASVEEAFREVRDGLEVGNELTVYLFKSGKIHLRDGYWIKVSQTDATKTV